MRTYPYLPIPERQEKPRTLGLTMVHDSGISPSHLALILESAAPYIDYYKFRNFTHALYPEAMTQHKIALCQEYDIKPFMGGCVAEFAWLHDVLDEHLTYTKAMGWKAIEISETNVAFSEGQKRELIKRCVGDGLEVIYEWGLRTPTEPLDPEQAAADIRRYVEAGVSLVMVEQGEIDLLIGKNGEGGYGERLMHLFELVGPDHLMVECGAMKQVAWFMLEMGGTINIGNVGVEEVIELEPLRRGIGRLVDNAIFKRDLRAPERRST